MIKQSRIHGIDALRAVAMLLGVLLHATIAYKAVPEKHWVHDEQFNNPVFDFLYFFIHSFRMSLFFVIAGFFCRFLYKRVNEREFIKRRWVRIGIPFLVGMLTIVPLGMIPYSMYVLHYRQGLDWHTSTMKAVFRLPGTSGLAHLWFLYDLMMFYFVTIVLMRLKHYSWFETLTAKFVKWWQTRSLKAAYWPFVLSIPVWIILIRDKELFALADTQIIPSHISYIIFYGYFFGLGWLIHLRQDVFNLLVRNYLFLLSVGMLILCILFYVEWRHLHEQSYGSLLLFKMLAAFQVVFLSFGFIGFFLKYFNLESKFWKYVSDASYWIYLVHLGMVIGLQLLFLESSVPGWLRFSLSLLIPVVISFATYEWFVRYSIIGKVLHGERNRIRR